VVCMSANRPRRRSRSRSRSFNVVGKRRDSRITEVEDENDDDSGGTNTALQHIPVSLCIPKELLASLHP